MNARGKNARHEIQTAEDERLLKEDRDEQEISKSLDDFAPGEFWVGEPLPLGNQKRGYTHTPKHYSPKEKIYAQHTIQVENEKSEMLKYMLSEFIGEMMEEHQSGARGSSKQPIPSIHKVPEKLRKLNESAYTPRVVSIGPIHNSDESLKEMEPRKVSYMCRLFGRTNRFDNETLEDAKHRKAAECVDAMAKMVANAQAYYEVKFQKLFDKVEFAKMMLVDACFILELVCYEKRIQVNSSTDPILSNDLVLVDIKHDLLLLENQIPFFALQKLFQLTVKQIPNHSEDLRLSQFILLFFDRGITKMDVIGDNHYHILDLLLKCYLPRYVEPSDRPIDKYTATELQRAGVTFKACKLGDIDVEFSTSCWFFWLCGRRTPSEIPKNCTYNPNRSCCLFSWLCLLFGRTRFTIPPISIHGYTESFLRNLIAFEQCSLNHDRTGFHVTSYAYLMDSLINSEEDVELLEKSGVLQNYLGASEDAKKLFNNICKEVVLELGVSFNKQFKDVQKYCELYWPKTLASLRANYFNNPWAFISVIAALILFVLTVVQTVYTIRPSSTFLGLGFLLKYMQ